ncbi:hypothetical protein O181_039914 [Austropuccinia psidii MF-1]|uniref:AMP-dependent synthetase/ligase domain-containing protein n=1 Tax=Austropuccinia psidii MF-1 TaxID=1389203 RepID=A0A9Q3HF00_9BASI|nr:hypothetical protein [Austropuccinia psidii MF-1]
MPPSSSSAAAQQSDLLPCPSLTIDEQSSRAHSRLFSESLIGPNHYGIPTLWEAFLKGYGSGSSSRDCLGSRLPWSSSAYQPSPFSQYRWLTYAQVFSKIRNLSMGLVEFVDSPPSSIHPLRSHSSAAIGLAQPRLALWCSNVPYWLISEYAAYRVSIAVVSINVQASSQIASEIINQTHPCAIILNAKNFERLVRFQARHSKGSQRQPRAKRIGFESDVSISPTHPNISFSDEKTNKQENALFQNLQHEPVCQEDQQVDINTTLFIPKPNSHSDTTYSSSDLFSVPPDQGLLKPIYIIHDLSQVSSHLKARSAALGFTFYGIEEVENLGDNKLKLDSNCHHPLLDHALVLESESLNTLKPCAETVAAIIYSSGTTGGPKACVITHGNFAANLAALDYLTKEQRLPNLHTSDLVHFSYLPLSHIYEKQAQAFTIYKGGSIGFSSLSSPRFLEDLSILKPTFLPSTPSFLAEQILEQRLQSLDNFNSFKNPVQSYLLTKAIEEKVKTLKAGHGENVWLWDKLVLGYLRDRLGGRLKWIVSGTASISKHVVEMLSASLSVKITEGYGLTETCGAASIVVEDELHDFKAGHVGVPLPCCEIKLVNVKGLDITKDQPFDQGEICIRGWNVFLGYLVSRTSASEDHLESVLDSQGWLPTGDVGYFDNHGRLHLTDRLIRNYQHAIPQQIHHQFNLINIQKIELALLSSVKELSQIFISTASPELCNPSSANADHPISECGQAGPLVGFAVIDVPNFMRWSNRQEAMWQDSMGNHLEHWDNNESKSPEIGLEANDSLLCQEGDSHQLLIAGCPKDLGLHTYEDQLEAEKLCSDPEIVKCFLKRLKIKGKALGLKWYELPVQLHLTTRPILSFDELEKGMPSADDLAGDASCGLKEGIDQGQHYENRQIHWLTMKMKNKILRQHFTQFCKKAMTET